MDIALQGNAFFSMAICKLFRRRRGVIVSGAAALDDGVVCADRLAGHLSRIALADNVATLERRYTSCRVVESRGRLRRVLAIRVLRS